ncbi:MAG: signal recognition particle protein Srp19 [Candidatus Altiarchaeota archaeon]|nr:signal recognition particle protein Srp19 [Candidatus Altiarchaeota archaeon]
MIGGIGKKLRDAVRSFVSRGTISERDIEVLLKDLQRVLISSDVDILTVSQTTKTIKKQIIGKKPAPGLTLKEHVLRVVYDELVTMLGTGGEVVVKAPAKIILVGIYGSGKTTTASKLGFWMKKKGIAPTMVSLDRDRPAAFDQLKQASKTLGFPVTKELPKDRKISLIVDTAGRDALDKKMLGDVKKIVKQVKPGEVFLVVPAEMGHIAGKQAEAMKELLTGVIITRMDGSAKGGGALSACAVAGVPVKFLGTGERIEDLELFEPKGFVSQLLGWGDIKGLLSKVKESEVEVTPEDLTDLNLITFYKQLEGLGKMGPVEKLLQMMGLTDLDKKTVSNLQNKLKKYKVMMDSMTIQEKVDPDTLSQSRLARIAKGSGCELREIKSMMKEFNTMKKMFKRLKKGRMPKGMKGMNMKGLQKAMSGMKG